MSDNARFGVLRVTRFYIPLLLQAFSQCLSYPLVGGIVTHCPMGVDALTAFAQGQTIMFMIGSLGGGLVMTGMVHAVNWSGYLAFRRLNSLMMGVLLVLQCLPALPPLDHWVFVEMLKLPPAQAEIARWTTLGGLVMNASFFLRNVPMTILFNNLQSGKANAATMARIAVTLALAVVFPRYGWGGPWWGLAALTLGVVVEFVLTWYFARPYVKELSQRGYTFPWHSKIDDLMAAKRRFLLVIEQLRFTLPLSFGSFLLAASPLAIAIFVGRAQDAAVMLAIHYVTIGVANPMGFGALRMQAVSIAFPPEHKGDHRMLWYAIGAGLVLGSVLILFSCPLVSNSYFGDYQNVPPQHLKLARAAIATYCLWPMLQAIRARIEGIAAVRRCPSAVMVGQISYLVTMTLSMALMLALGVIGWKISVYGIYVATLCTVAAEYATLYLVKGGGEERR